MERVEEGFFRLYHGMFMVAQEFSPEAISDLGHMRPLRMARATTEVGGCGSKDSEVLEELGKAKRLKEIFDRAFLAMLDNAEGV